MPEIEELIEMLHLKPHPAEGGYFVETYRSAERIETPAGMRSLSTAIFYLMTPAAFSALHRLTGEEIFHFYFGDPVEMLQLLPDGSSTVFVLGPRATEGMRPQLLVPRGVWQGSHLLPGGSYALLGTTMSPGFDPADYEPGKAEELLRRYPQERKRILELTR